MLYLRKRDPEQAFCEWAAAPSPRAFPFIPLKELVTKDRSKVSESYARRVLDFLRAELQMPEDDTPNIRCPVEVLDEEGPITLA